MSAKVGILMLICLSVAPVKASVAVDTQADRLLFAGGPLSTFSESLLFCQRFGHQMLGSLTDSDRYLLAWNVFKQTAPDHWINATLDGRYYATADDGLLIRNFFWKSGEPSCVSSSCRVTIMHESSVCTRTRTSAFRARNLCVIRTKELDSVDKLALLWTLLNDEERATVANALPGHMVRVNMKVIQSLQETVKRDSERITRLEQRVGAV